MSSIQGGKRCVIGEEIRNYTDADVTRRSLVLDSSEKIIAVLRDIRWW